MQNRAAGRARAQAGQFRHELYQSINIFGFAHRKRLPVF
jgi:hypothetical protein